jgi:hypothetical protein
VSTALARELGRAIVNFGRLEWNLAYAISGLTGPYSAAGQMVALELPFMKKRALFQALCQHELSLSSRSVSGECERLLRGLAECESALKRFSHPLWLGAPRDRRGGGDLRSRMTAVESRRARPFREAEIKRVKAVADEIARLADAIPAFVRQHRPSELAGRPTRG